MNTLYENNRGRCALYSDDRCVAATTNEEAIVLVAKAKPLFLFISIRLRLLSR